MQKDLKVFRSGMDSSEFAQTLLNYCESYIHDGRDRSSVSLVCRNWYKIDCETRKHVTVAMCYATTPLRLCQQVPFLESLTIKGKPRAAYYLPDKWGGYAEPWVRKISSSLNFLTAIHFRRMIVHDSDIDLLTRTRGQKLRVLKLDDCSGFSTDGLLHIGKRCNNLQILYLEESEIVEEDGDWLHELALRNRALESLNFCNTGFVKLDFKNLEIIAQNCESLISVKISECDLTHLSDFFKYAVKLQEFSGGLFVVEELEKYDGFQLPPLLTSIALDNLCEETIPVILPLSSRITKLDLQCSLFDTEEHCSLLERCTNLEVLYARHVIGDRGLRILAQFCKKLRRIKIIKAFNEVGFVSQTGLISLAEGCPELECLYIVVNDITNAALTCVGRHLKKLSDYFMLILDDKKRITELPLDMGVRALLEGCSKLERLGICVRPGGLTDVGLEYIGQYAQNVRYLFLGFSGNSDSGLLKLSKGCPKLQKLEMRGCPFSEEALASSMTSLASLKSLWVQHFGTNKNGDVIKDIATPLWNLELITCTTHPLDCQNRYYSAVRSPSLNALRAYRSLAGQRKDFSTDVDVDVDADVDMEVEEAV